MRDGLKTVQTGRHHSLVWAILFLAAGVFFASPAVAQDNARQVTLALTVIPSGQHDGDDDQLERARLVEISRMAAERIEARLRAARIKHFEVVVEPPHTIEITVRGSTTEAMIAGIVVPSGRFELRPVEAVGEQLTELAVRLGAGVELRQESASLSSSQAYLFSRSRRSLEQAIEAIDVDGVDLLVYPSDDGWKSLAVGEPVATHDDVNSATMKRGKTGDVYVGLELARALDDHDKTSADEHIFAAVLDGEVVATTAQGSRSRAGSLVLTAPDHLTGRKARSAWARQVAGRLAAPIAVRLIELSDD